jgi:uncharacterized protein (DUF779 family)
MSVLNRTLADPAAAAAPGTPVLGTPDALPQQVVATPAAIELIDYLREKHGPVMFHQSGGCCDGSSPMCYPLGEFYTGDSDVLLGYIAPENDPSGAPFYISKPQFEYWKHTQLILDVVPGRGGMFSLENSEGLRFLIRGRVFTDPEIAELRATGKL